MISHVREVPLRKQLGCTRGVLANEESVDEHFDVVEGAEHGRCEDRSETNAGEVLLPYHLLGSKAEHATTAWRLFGGLLLVLAILAVLASNYSVSKGPPG